MKNRYWLIPGLIGLLLLTLSFGVVTAHEGGGHVRVAHLSPDAPAVDVYIGDQLALQNLAYKGISGYLPVEGFSLTVALVPAGSPLDQAVLTTEVVLPEVEEGYYTIAAVGLVSDASLELLVLPADSEALGSAKEGKLSVRGVYVRATASATEHETEEMSQATEEAATGGMGGMDMAQPTEEAGAMGGMSMDAVSAAYMFIQNDGDTPEKLVAVQAEFAGMVQIHQTTVTDGMAQMAEVEGGLEIPAHGNVELKPGSYHVMMMGLKQDLVAGEVVHLTLVFESGTTLTVDAPVRALTMQ